MVFLDIWRSYRALPLWVQIWVLGILMPVNLAALFFMGQPGGVWVAVLAIGAMLPNIGILVFERGLSKMMAFPHLLPWSGLIIWLLVAMPQGSAAYGVYLWVLIVVNGISLGFDFPDGVKWWRGDRAIAGK
ncbi:MAG: hypothetical protein L3J37_07165 [Rhodobacteraceae bacterium]|nr:hypothetical protein [Paracoccaceae bacterium]